MIRTQTLFTAMAAALSLSAGVALASDGVESEYQNRQQIQERSQLRMDLKEAASQQDGLQRELQLRERQREREQERTSAHELREQGPMRVQIVGQRLSNTTAGAAIQNQTRTQTRTQEQVRTQSHTMFKSHAGESSGHNGSRGR
jgi:hypothetical protein